MGEVEHIRQKSKTPKVILGIVLAVLVVGIIILKMCLVVTDKDEYTLIRRFGKVERVVEEPGLSFKTPFIEEASTIPRNTLLFDLAISDVITLDKQTMIADSYVLWKITDPKLFVQTLNGQIGNAEARINTTVYNSLKIVIGSMQKSEIVTGRDGVLSQKIMESIGDSMKQYGIELICVETKHLDLPDDNKEAVYQRMISERNNIAAKNSADGEKEAQLTRSETDRKIAVLLSEANAKAAEIVAEGEAEYMKILSQAYSDTSRSDFYTFVRSLDAAKKMLTGSNKTLILNSDSPIAQIFNNIQ